MTKYISAMSNWLILIVTLCLIIVALEYFSSMSYLKITSEKGRNAVDILMYGKQSISTGNFKENGHPISEIELLPYYLYRNKPGSKINGEQQVNKEGYRNGNKEFYRKEDIVRILAVGGSTTYGWLIQEYQQAWPAQLESILNEKYGQKVEVINAGLPGGTSSESLISFILKDKFLKPDIVIFHNGGNDIPMLFYDDYYPDYRYFKKVSGHPELRPFEYKAIKNSNFIKLLYALWLKDINLSTIRPSPIKPAELNEALINVKNNQPVGFYRNMDTLIQETIAIGAIPVIFPFHLANIGIYKELPKGMCYAKKLHPASSLALDKNKVVLKTLAQKYSLAYHEMPQNQIEFEKFFDHCHMKPEGDRVKAEYIAQYIIPIIKKV